MIVMKKSIIVFGIFLYASLFVSGDDAIYQARISSAIAELELNDFLALWFTDADTGQPIAGALVAIKNFGGIKTDNDGLAVFPVVEDGEHQFIIQKEGYITYRDSFNVFGGSIFFYKYSVPRLLSVNNIKVVVDWGDKPEDIDAHFVKEGKYHISYRDTKKSEDGAAWLDRDDTDGYGPETITVTQLDNEAIYRCFVHNYSERDRKDSSSLSASKVTVRVFIDNKFYAAYQVQSGVRGTTWNVFNIVNGKIQLINLYE
jgi:hypothetical protein